MRGIAEQEDAARAIAVGLTGVLSGDAAQRVRPVTGRWLDRELHTEHSLCAGAQFVERHRRGIIRIFVELDGSEHRPTTLHLCEDESAIVETVVAPWQRPEARNVETTISGTHFVGHTHVGDPRDRVGRVPGKVDASRLAHGATAAVGAHEVSRDQ